VKIGVAGHPQQRLEDLQCANPERLVLIAERPGTFELERQLHERFAPWRIRGEWFRADAPGLWGEIELALILPRDRYVCIRRPEESREEAAMRLLTEGLPAVAQAFVESATPELGVGA